ncbi:hypothetical protein T492DRAFT_1096788 [Pavlovales sp. CCMP2436]|nr:hypothetical protein T492DRAFT_1096788 [Pavlovales sp. CCMP2436]
MLVAIAGAIVATRCWTVATRFAAVGGCAASMAPREAAYWPRPRFSNAWMRCFEVMHRSPRALDTASASLVTNATNSDARCCTTTLASIDVLEPGGSDAETMRSTLALGRMCASLGLPSGWATCATGCGKSCGKSGSSMI